jgi:acyl-CoA reductase-like NAD-dependent aldehyde dehydrogenase
VAHIFKQIRDGVEEKREEALQWLADYGDTLVRGVQDKADGLLTTLQTLAGNSVGDTESRQAAVTAAVAKALSDAQAEIARLKAEAADAVTEKRKEVMYAIKDLKIEIGTTFKAGKKAAKKAEIESLVSELESFINKTIRTYDESVDDQIAIVNSATSAAGKALWDQKQ